MGLEDSHDTLGGLGTLQGLCVVGTQERPHRKDRDLELSYLTSGARRSAGQARCFQENETTTMCPVLGMAAEAQGSLRDVEGRSCERSHTVAGV